MRKHTEFKTLNLLSPSHVTEADLLNAASITDIDAACLMLQKLLEQKDGGMAGIFFSGSNYDQLDFWGRHNLLVSYVGAELREAVFDWREALQMIGSAIDACLSEDPCDNGFEEIHAGGGCLALLMRERLQDGWWLELMMTDTGGSAIPTKDELEARDFDLGLYLRDPLGEWDQLAICYGKDLALYRTLLTESLAPVVHPLGQCPECGGDASDGSGFEVDGTIAIQQCICSECGNSWTDTYELKSSITDED